MSATIKINVDGKIVRATNFIEVTKDELESEIRTLESQLAEAKDALEQYVALEAKDTQQALENNTPLPPAPTEQDMQQMTAPLPPVAPEQPPVAQFDPSAQQVPPAVPLQ